MNSELTDAEIAAMAVVDAERGDADAQAYLGISYTHGWDGFDEDPLLALHWFRLAAAQGLPDAQYNLAFLHDIGDGVPKDPVEAQRLYARGGAGPRRDTQCAQGPLGHRSSACVRGRNTLHEPFLDEEGVRTYRAGAR